MKGRLDERPIRLPTNPNPFNQEEVNFVEIVFYDELTPDDECPTLGTPRAPILEEEEEGNTRDLRDLLDKKRKKKEASFLGSRECVIVWEPIGKLIYYL